MKQIAENAVLFMYTGWNEDVASFSSLPATGGSAVVARARTPALVANL